MDGAGTAAIALSRQNPLTSAGPRRHLANVIGTNAFTVITVLVGLVVTGQVIRHLGLATYGTIAAVIYLSNIVTVLGNPLSGGAGRYVTQELARGKDENAASYLVNTLALVVSVALVALVGMGAYAWFSAKFDASMILFMEVMIVSVMISATGQVLSCGTFVREQFLLRSGIRILSRTTYGVIVVTLLAVTGLGMWSLPAGALASALIQAVCFGVTLKVVLPSVSLRLKYVEVKRTLEVGAYVGWVLLAYVGAYVIRAGVMLLAKEFLDGPAAGRYALAVQAGAMLLQGLTTLAVVTSVATYKALAVNDFRSATRQVERFVFLALCVGLAGVAVLTLEGQALLKLWLGDKAPPLMTPMLVGVSVTALATSSNVPLSVFLGGCDRIRTYGIACLIEGLVVFGGAWALLAFGGEDLLVYVVFLPAVVVLAKNGLVIPILYRGTFVLSPGREFVRKGLVIAVLTPLAIGAWWLARAALPGDGVVEVGVRVLAIAVLPLGFVAAYLGRRK